MIRSWMDIRPLRRKLGVGLQTLAHKTLINVGTLSCIELGKYPLNTEHKKRIEDALLEYLEDKLRNF